MKNIHFDNLKNPLWIGIAIVSVICILIGLVKPFGLEEPIYYKYVSAIGFVGQGLFFTKLYWYKNYVQWNRLSIIIRVNRFWAKTIKFEDIKATDLNESRLKITLEHGEIFRIDLKDIAKSDVYKLNQILLRNIISQSV